MTQTKLSPFKQLVNRVSRLSLIREPRYRHTNFFEGVLGTSLEMQIVSSNGECGPWAENAVLSEIDRLETIFNAYDNRSELCRWQNSYETDLAVSPELAQVLSDAENWRKETLGAFNPAVEAFTRLWKAVEKDGGELSRHQLAVIGVHSKQPLWRIDLDQGIARRLTRLPVTLNSIAKGFIIDSAARAGAEVEGVEEILVNIGGDIRHIGSKKVIVAIADPLCDAENATPIARVELSNCGIATSGNYRRGFRIGANRYSHLIDPRSGWPVERAIGVSVAAPDAATADVLATVFSVLAPEESLEFANSLPDIGVLLLTSQGERFSNSNWDELVQNN